MNAEKIFGVVITTTGAVLIPLIAAWLAWPVMVPVATWAAGVHPAMPWIALALAAAAIWGPLWREGVATPQVIGHPWPG